MTAEPGFDWSEADRLFDRALEIAPGARAAWVAQACGGNAALQRQVEALLRADAAAGRFLELDGWRLADPATDGLPPAPERPVDDSAVGRGIGPYRIVRELARGGMGVVYLAERADGQFEQRVALKLIRKGMDSAAIHRRFLAERQILARLNHPHIARLLDGGVTAQGQPWFAIEFVEGATIVQHCEAHGLDVDARLRLFLDVCDAVRYAHQNLVVHRDLKPSNILVTADGQAKLLDFGIAKLVDREHDETESGVRVMTPEYAAPEQVRGEPVTTATDVYALGAVLYELLAGRRMHRFERRSPTEMVRSVLFEAPEPPSVVAPQVRRRRLQGDLDTIVLTAVRKEPDRRYSAVEQFASDVRRHLDRMPVSTRADSVGYRTAKFVGRHRVAVAAGAAVALSLLAGVAGTVWQARIAAERARAASDEAATQRAVRNFLVQLFEAADPGQSGGRELTARELLARGRRGIDTTLAGHPEARAELMAVLAGVHGSLGYFAPADTLYSQAVALTRTLPGDVRPALAERLTRQAANLLEQDQYDRADSLVREALALLRAAGTGDAGRAAPLRTQAWTQSLKGNGTQAVALAREALSIDLRHGSDSTPDVADDLASLGNALYTAGDLAGADSAGGAALAIRRRILRPGHPALLRAMSDAAVIRGERGDHAGAERLFREILAERRRLYPNGHPELAQTLEELGYWVEQQGRSAEAESLYVQSLAMYRSLLGPDHSETARTMTSLAGVRYERGELEPAESDMREAARIYRRALGPEHPQTLSTIDQLGIFVRERGGLTEAEALLREALAGRRKVLGDSALEVGQSLTSLALLEHRRGDDRQAEALLRRSLAIQRRALPSDAPGIASPLASLGMVLNSRGRAAEAEPLLREALAVRTASLGPTHHKTAAVRRELGYALALERRYAEAEPLLLQAYRDLDVGRDYWSDKERRATLERLAELYRRQGKTGEAKKYAALAAR